jgi:hypothetical protein
MVRFAQKKNLAAFRSYLLEDRSYLEQGPYILKTWQ